MNLEEFKKKHKPKKKSGLEKFKSEILSLRQDNFSLESITLFLNKNGVQTTFQNVTNFLKRVENQGDNEFVKPLPKPKIEIEKPKPSSLSEFKFEKKGADHEIKPPPEWAM